MNPQRLPARTPVAAKPVVVRSSSTHGGYAKSFLPVGWEFSHGHSPSKKLCGATSGPVRAIFDH